MRDGDGQQASPVPRTESRRGGPRPDEGSEAELLRHLTEISADLAPRRFTLCEIDSEREDGWVRGWGLAFEDVAVLVGDGCGLLGSFQSAESALALFSQLADLRLVWIDRA